MQRGGHDGGDITFATEGEGGFYATKASWRKAWPKCLTPSFADILRFCGSGLHANLLKKIEKFIVQKALVETMGNQVQAAKILGISRNTLRNRMDKYNLPP